MSIAAPSFQPNASACIKTTVTSSTECMGTVETTANTTFSANAHLNSASSGVSTSCTVVLGKHTGNYHT